MSANHPSRSQVRVPARLWDELMLALDQLLTWIETLDPDPDVVTRQVHEFGERTLDETRRRARKQNDRR